VPLTVLVVLLAYLLGRGRSRRRATSAAAASVGNAYERRADLPPPQQSGMVMGGVGPMGMAGGPSELDVKSGSMPMYAAPPSSMGSPMMAGYTPPPQGMMLLPPQGMMMQPLGMQQAQELPAGSYVVYPQEQIHEAPAGGQTPVVAQAMPHELAQ
jgi:hypothetical protein